MASKKHKRKLKVGLAPGSLVFTGVQKMPKINISLMYYSESNYEEKKINNITELVKSLEYSKDNTWVNIEGLHDENTIEEICTYLGI